MEQSLEEFPWYGNPFSEIDLVTHVLEFRAGGIPQNRFE